MSTYKSNHVLSRSLLKRFIDGRNFIGMVEPATGVEKAVPYGDQGFRKRLWQKDAKIVMEQFWSDESEQYMGRIFKQIDNNEQLEAKDYQVLVRFLATHYVRSNEFLRVYDSVRKEYCSIVRLKSEFQDFFPRYMIHLELLRQTAVPSAFFETTMKYYYEKISRDLSGCGIDIGVATGNETFVLPDGGLLVLDSTIGIGQPSRGIGINNADHAVMPLGPRHIAAFNSLLPTIRYRDLNDQEVRNANANLQHAVIERYYKIP